MADYSISFVVGNRTSISHNNRKHTSGNKDIDVSKSDDNKYYVQRDIKEVYKELFGEAVEEYNNKQKRSDRKIKDYYKKILNDNKTNHQSEIIVAIGKVDDGLSKELKINALDTYAKAFQKNNPNLAVYNMVLHVDEANPHLHINYVPFFDSKRGLKKRVGQNKALNQQGFEGKTVEVFKNWRTYQTKLVESTFSVEYQRYIRNNKEQNIAKPKRITVGSHKYMTVPEYKNYKEKLDSLKLELEKVDKELKNTTKSEFFKLKKENEELLKETTALKKQLKGVETVLKELPYNVSNNFKIVCSDVFLRLKASGHFENVELPEFLQSDKYKQSLNKPVEIKPQKVDISDFNNNNFNQTPKSPKR